MNTLSDKSIRKLSGVNPLLVNVVKRAIEISSVDFGVTEGLRSFERQREMVRTKKSQTMNSKHLTGRAVDLVAWINGTISWEWEYYVEIAKAMKQAAKELNVNIEWGGDWKFRDGVHFQLKD